MAEREGVDEFVWVNARRGIAGQIPDVVRAGAASQKPDRLNAAQHLRRVLRLDEAQLKIGARRDLDVAGGQFPGDAGQLAELVRFDLAGWNPQPTHKRLLVWREKKQAVPFEAENIFLVRRFVGGGVFEQQRVGIERMQLLLDSFLENLRFEIFLVGRGSVRLADRVRFDIGECQAAILQPREQAFEVGHLFTVELLTGDFGERKRGGAHWSVEKKQAVWFSDGSGKGVSPACRWHDSHGRDARATIPEKASRQGIEWTRPKRARSPKYSIS